MKILRPIVLVAVLLVAAALVIRGTRSGEAGETVYPGYGEGEFVYVSAPLGGELETLDVRRGELVAKEAVLFELEREQEAAARGEAAEMARESQARLDKASLDFNRARSLREKRVTSPEDYDAAQQELLSAQHTAAARQQALQQADWKHAQKRQTAPAAGLVYDTYFRPGEWVPAGSPIVALLPPEYLKVRFFVPERDLGKFQPGRTIEVRMDGLEKPLPGRVSFVSPQAEYTLPIIYSRENRDKLVFLLEGSFEAEDARRLHPGAPVEVRLVPEKQNPP